MDIYIYIIIQRTHTRLLCTTDYIVVVYKVLVLLCNHIQVYVTQNNTRLYNNSTTMLYKRTYHVSYACTLHPAFACGRSPARDLGRYKSSLAIIRPNPGVILSTHLECWT